MSFWYRHIFLLFACVVAPFGAGLWVDTQSEISRALTAGRGSAKLAMQGLQARLTLEAHGTVSSAISLAQEVSEKTALDELSRPGPRRDAGAQALARIIEGAQPKGGFVWVLDEQGVLLAASDHGTSVERPARIGGHPLFRDSQEGFALDGIWKQRDQAAMVGAAPLTVKGRARGAVLVGKPIDKAMLSGHSTTINAEISVVSGDGLLASTIDGVAVRAVVDATKGKDEAVSNGALSTPLSHDYLPWLPLFIDRNANGLAYTTLAARGPGIDNVRWIISVPTAEGLRQIGNRQEMILGGMIATLMLAILIGLLNYRTFVKPIDRITEHLSEIQFGRGEMELSEASVSGPFRRLVKLVNMTVQKIPMRSLPTRPVTAEAPLLELGSSDALSRPVVLARLIPEAPRENAHSSILGITGSEPITDIAASLSPIPSPSFPSQSSLPRSTSSVSLRSLQMPTSMEKEKERGLEGPEADALADAIATMSSLPSPGLPRLDDDDEADAIAEAIASLESQSAPAAKAKTATDIRGAPMGSHAASIVRGTSPIFDEMLAPSGDIPSESPFSARDRVNGGSSLRSGGSLNGYVDGGPSVPPYEIGESSIDADDFNPEATVVSAVADDLLARSIRDDADDLREALALMGGETHAFDGSQDTPRAPGVSEDLPGTGTTLSTSDVDFVGGALDAADRAHFKETYERFVDMRKRCGEPTADLAFDRFLAKLTKNRVALIGKYNCRTVRFQVYEKDGKAALKATPVRNAR